MATILFVMKYPLHRPENLKGKFDGQLAAARQLGHEAFCIGWDDTAMWLLGDGSKEKLINIPMARMPGYDHTLIFTDLMKAVRKVLKKRHIDLLYLRYMPTFRGAVKTMRRLKAQGGLLVLEHPTYPRDTGVQKTFIRRPVFFYTDQVLKRINPMVDLYTLIGEPAGNTLDGRPAMNINNGVSLDGLPLHVPAPQGDVHLLALASMAKWHGYDRVIRAMAQYAGEERVFLHMVGPDGDGSLEAWKRLAAELKLEKQVIFHGPLYGEALDAVIARCDVGLGVLAMHRMGLDYVMALKIREYMARGLPFISASLDTAIEPEGRYALMVPDDESALDMERVVAFAKRAKQDTEIPLMMRAYAREHLSWESVLDAVFARVGL